jgi:hypothetical protein
VEIWAYQVVLLNLKVKVSRIAAAEKGKRPEFDSIGQVLNKYGREGWELVSVINDPDAGVVAFLKRRFTPDEPEQAREA